MRRIWSVPLIRERPDEIIPSCSSLFTMRDACDRDIPRNSETPSCVISRGAPNSMVSGMWR